MFSSVARLEARSGPPSALIGVRDREVAGGKLDRHLDGVSEQRIRNRQAGKLLADGESAPEQVDPKFQPLPREEGCAGAVAHESEIMQMPMNVLRCGSGIEESPIDGRNEARSRCFGLAD